MKLAPLALTLACTACFGQMKDQHGVYQREIPSRYSLNGVVYGNVSPGWLVANAGWSWASQDEVAADAQMEAEAVAIAEAEEYLRQMPRWKAENAFLSRAASASAQFGVNLGSSDSYQSALAKLKAAPLGERIDRIEAGLELMTLWEVVLFHGGKWGEVKWHPEVEE